MARLAVLRETALSLILLGAAGCGGAATSSAKAVSDPTIGSVRAPGGTSWGEIIYHLDSLVMSKVARYELIVDGEPERRTKPAEFPHATDAASRTRMLFLIDVSDVGSIVAVNGKPATPEAYRSDLSTWLRSAQGRPAWVIVRADTHAPFARVVDVVKTAQDLGAFIAFRVDGAFATEVRLKPFDWQKCGRFPPASDAARVDNWVVVVRAHVDAEGNATKVDVLEGDEYGFGAIASGCAARARYEPARATDKRPIDGTKVFRIRFERPAPRD